MSTPDLAWWIAENEIRQVVLRYFRGVDRCDLEAVRQCYHPDATDTHGSFSGGVEDYLQWLARLLPRYERTFHLMGNCLVEPHPRDPERARCETYGVAFHAGPADRAETNLTTAFRFADQFSRRGGHWRISRRVAITEHSWRTDPGASWPVPEGFLRGTRDDQDPALRWE